MVLEKVGLISKTECEESKVSQEEADNFLKVKEDDKKVEVEKKDEEEAEDLVCIIQIS